MPMNVLKKISSSVKKDYLYYTLFFVIILLLVYVLYTFVYKKKFEFYDNMNQTSTTSAEDDLQKLFEDHKNIITNGDFAGGKDVGGYTDQSGSNTIMQMANPTTSPYVLRQQDSTNLTYYEIIQPAVANATYAFMSWVRLDSPINSTSTEIINFQQLFRVRILKKTGSNELPPVRVTIIRTMDIGGAKWYLVKYVFNTSGDVKDNMNIYLNYGSELIAKDIYFAGIGLYQILGDVDSFIYTNGLTSFISGFYCDSGSLSWKDLSTLGNNFTLINRASVDTKEGSVLMFNNKAIQAKSDPSYAGKPTFMMNILCAIQMDHASEEDKMDKYSIVAIKDGISQKVAFGLYVKDNNTLMLQCGSKFKETTSPVKLNSKTLLSIAFNNDLHKVILYQDCVQILTLDGIDPILFMDMNTEINGDQYLKLTLYDMMVHNYILLDNELKDLRSYLMDTTLRTPRNVPSLFDYIIPQNWRWDGTVSSLSSDSTSGRGLSAIFGSSDDYKDPFYRAFQNNEQVYTNIKNETCSKPVIKPSDCPTAYKKGDDFYIFINKDSYYHNKLGYYGEKYYGTDKAKVKYIYEMNFPDCQLPMILTENEGKKFSNTCPFIIDQNNPCGMVGCGGVDWSKKYVEDLGLKDPCKKAVSYYCRINYDLDPKCVAWKPSNKDDAKSKNIRKYFENPDEYCDIRNYKIEDHPDFKDYIKKDKIPCWGCNLDANGNPSK